MKATLLNFSVLFLVVDQFPLLIAGNILFLIDSCKNTNEIWNPSTKSISLSHCVATPDKLPATTDRRQLFYLFYFTSFFFLYFICMSAFLVRTSGHMIVM